MPLLHRPQMGLASRTIVRGDVIELTEPITMIPLKPISQVDLSHRAFSLRGARRQSVIVATSTPGSRYYSVVDCSLGQVREHRHSAPLQIVSPHPTAPVLAVAERALGAITIQAFGGESIAVIPPAKTGETAPNWHNYGFIDCCFDERGEFLWCVARQGSRACHIVLVETTNWFPVQSLTLDDPFVGSDYSLQCAGDQVVLWLAAGQDGQQVYWLRRQGGHFTCDIEPCLQCTTPPIFSPSNKELLVVDCSSAIRRYSFPSMEQLGTLAGLDEGDDQFAESLVYISDDQVFAGTNEGRVFSLDTTSLSIEDEVAIEGHEPRPVGEYWPSLDHESGFATDIRWFTKAGGAIVFVYEREWATGARGEKDSLLLCAPE